MKIKEVVCQTQYEGEEYTVSIEHDVVTVTNLNTSQYASMHIDSIDAFIHVISEFQTFAKGVLNKDETPVKEPEIPVAEKIPEPTKPEEKPQVDKAPVIKTKNVPKELHPELEPAIHCFVNGKFHFNKDASKLLVPKPGERVTIDVEGKVLFLRYATGNEGNAISHCKTTNAYSFSGNTYLKEIARAKYLKKLLIGEFKEGRYLLTPVYTDPAQSL